MKNIRFKSIKTKLLAYILLASTFVTTISTSINFFIDYKSENDGQEAILKQIEKVTLKSLSDALWKFDHQQVRSNLQGLVQIRDVKSLTVFSDKKEIVSSVNNEEISDEYLISKKYDLFFTESGEKYSVGSFEVTITKYHMYERLAKKLFVTLFTQFIKTIIISFIILYLFNYFVTKRIIHLQKHMQAQTNHDKGQIENYSFSYGDNVELDEINLLAKAFNNLGSEINSYTEKNLTLLESTQAELSTREDLLQKLFHMAPIGIALNNMEGAFIEANPELLRITGYTLEELNKLSYWDLTPQKYEPQEKVQLDNLEKTQKYGPYVKEYIHKNGQLINVLLHGHLVKDNHGQDFIWSVIQDITELMKREAVLIEAKEKANEANKEKSLFLANISHELRTPLNAILGFVNLLLEENGFNEQQRDSLNTIKASSDHLLLLINDLLNLTKLKQKETILNYQPTDLLNFFQSVNTIFKKLAEDKNIQYDFIHNITPDFKYNIDQKILKQILMNLLSNAVKFTDQGYVKLQAEIFITKSGHQLTLKVEDSGQGISNDFQENIFKAFSQDSKSLKSNLGTGLGLSITKELVQKLGGNLLFSSRENVGTTFNFSISIIPIQKEKVQSNIKDSKSTIAQFDKSLRMLVVEDNKINQKLLISFLKTFNQENIHCVNDGVEALDFLENNDIDLIWMDYLMPNLDGAKTSKKIRSNEKSKNVYIVGLTACAHEQDLDAMLNAGCNEVITKPISKENIKKVLKKLLNNQP